MVDYYYNGDGESDNGDYGNGHFDMNGMKWLSLIVLACVSFWCQSIVTEERSVHDIFSLSFYLFVSHTRCRI